MGLLRRTFSFDERKKAIGKATSEAFVASAWPNDIDELNRGGGAETIMQSQIAIGYVTRSASLFLNPYTPTSRHRNPRTNSVAV